MIELELFPIDFKQGENGQIAFVHQQGQTYSYSLASFIMLETNSIILEPFSKKSIKITITNRPDLSPGGHYAAVVARIKQTNKTNSSNTSILPSLSSMILLRKTGGERYNLSLKSINWPSNIISFFYPKSIQLLFQNEGNTHLLPFGTIEIRDMFNRKIYDGTINVSSLYVFPETWRYIVVDLKKINWVIPLSINYLNIKGHDSLHKTIFFHNNTFIYINPIVIFGIVISILAWFFLKKKKIK
jgi:hypothetical protein